MLHRVDRAGEIAVGSKTMLESDSTRDGITLVVKLLQLLIFMHRKLVKDYTTPKTTCLLNIALRE